MITQIGIQANLILIRVKKITADEDRLFIKHIL
jgi:hypothetical protein